MSSPLWPLSFKASEHFKVSDFNCNDTAGTPYPPDKIMTVLLPFCLTILEVIRTYVASDRPIIVLSGYRTPEWNEHEGGAPDSRHIHGDAADIWCPSLGLTAGPELYLAVLSLHRAGFLPRLGGLGRYSNRIHVDTRPHSAGTLSTWDNVAIGTRG
jgi:hypothetical protein